MTERAGAPLAPHTTLQLGGPARRLVEAHSAEEIVEFVAAADAAEEPLLLLGGGSNVVLPDEGFDGLVVRLASHGVDMSPEAGSSVLVTAQSGEPWDPFVEQTVAAGLAGIEALSGIPGQVGASPIQNIGAYGQEVAQTVTEVSVYDRATREVLRLPREACGFGYRSSVFKREASKVVLEVSFRLSQSGLSRPVTYAELARALGIEIGEQAPLADVREAVLTLRRRKGMVVDPADPDSVSAGSFFTNPVLEPDEVDRLARRVEARLGTGVSFPQFPEPDGRIKLSAAWLIENAGFAKGHGTGPVRISTKHTLALTNRGGGTTAALLGLAREIQAGVRDAFGVELVPEPVLVNGAL